MQALPDPRFDRNAEAYFAHIAARDLEAWMALFAKAAVLHDPIDSLPATTNAEIRESWKALTAPFESLGFALDLRIFGESGAAVKWTGEATGIDGSQATFEGITLFEFDDSGAIEAVVGYWDPAAVLIELAGESDQDTGVPDA
jgi:steroid delta-isomerase